MEREKEFTEYLNKVLIYYKKKSNVKLRRFTNKSREYDVHIDNYKKIYSQNAEFILADFSEALEEYNKEVKKKDASKIIENFPNSFLFNNGIQLFIDTHVFYRLYKMQIYKEIPLTKIEDITKNNDHESTMWYRGQTNKNWSLIPSFFRNNRPSLLWDWDNIYKDYKSSGRKVSLITKLAKIGINKIYTMDIGIKASGSPYQTASFIQHAIGYSPLIDFTKSPAVALSFALSNTASTVDYNKNDACVFSLNIEDYNVLTDLIRIDNVLLSAKTQTFKTNESIINILTNKMWQDILMGAAKSTIYLINRPTNDRMLFQKGTFILYDNAIIIGDEVFMSYDKAGFLRKKVIKYTIDAKLKGKLYEDLMNRYPEYHQRYLLDPYFYLSELDK